MHRGTLLVNFVKVMLSLDFSAREAHVCRSHNDVGHASLLLLELADSSLGSVSRSHHVRTVLTGAHHAVATKRMCCSPRWWIPG